MQKKTAKQIKDFRHECVDIYKMSRGCDNCGYNKHPSSLCFDHLPDYEKSPITKNGKNNKWVGGGMYNLYNSSYNIEYLISEIKKCRLLCHNCHMEHTHPNNTRFKNASSLDRIDSIDDLEIKLRSFEIKLDEE